MGLFARAIVEALSHMTRVGVGTVTPRSSSKHLNQEISQVLSARAMYSSSVELLDTTVCFFDCQETKLCPKNTAYPETDLLVMAQLALSLSQ